MNVATIGFAGGLLLIILGIYCLAAKSNMIRLILGVEILTNGAIVVLVTFGATPLGTLNPAIISLAILAVGVGGCIAAVGLAIVIQAYRHYRTLDVRELKRLRW
ncbi:MAG: multicomponent Na+:H+ antiporter subunit C [Candidatus Hecatellales archaeon B24]|nr:MAG: multicomponent Na+:H+ antiporter subunit C [Candidatus Hecatellales archaeon B24]